MSDLDLDLDLDAELLALAGGDDEPDKPDEPAQTPTPQPSPKIAVEDKPSTTSQPRKGVAQKKMTKSSRGGARRRRKDESDDEADASAAASDVDSLGSGAMDESDSEADAPGEPDDDDELFPVEGKFHSEKDRAQIMALPEIEREQIIAERQEQLLRKQQDAQLKRLLVASEREQQKAAEKKKRKAGAADLDESPRKSSRARTKPSTALESFKREREARLKERERDADRRKRRSPSARSDLNAEGESEVEWDDGARRGLREDISPDIRDFERVRVGRSNFAKVCFYPEFEKAISGCFARVSVGMDQATGTNIYRMAQIKSFAEGKPYQMEGPNGKMFWIDQYAVVAHGKSEKTWPFIATSDGKFTDQEFNRYKIAIANDNLRLPSKDALQKSCQGIHDLLNRQWTDGDIRQKLAKQNKLAHLNAKAPKVPQPSEADLSLNGISSGSPTSAKKENMTQADRLWALNQANRKKNLEEIRKAQIEERRKAAAGRAAAAAKAAEKERVEAEAAAAKASLQVPESNIDDLFGSDISRTGSPAPGSGISTPKRTGTPLGKKLAERKEKREKEGLPTFKKRNMDDDLIGAMDLGIEIDI